MPAVEDHRDHLELAFGQQFGGPLRRGEEPLRVGDVGVVGEPDPQRVQLREMLQPQVEFLGVSRFPEIVPDRDTVAAPTWLVVEAADPRVLMDA